MLTFYRRKPRVRATAGAAAGTASWSGAEGDERTRTRNAEKVMIMLYHAWSIKANIECTDTIHHKALSEITIIKNDQNHCRNILHSFLYLRNAERANTRCSQSQGVCHSIMIFTRKQKRHLSRCCASRSS